MGFLDLFTKAVGQKIEEKIVDLAEKKEEQRKQNEDSQKKLGGERELDMWKERHEVEEKQTEKLYEDFVAIKKKIYKENEVKRKVANISKQIGETGLPKMSGIGKNYSFFEQLTIEERKTEYVKNYIINLTNMAYESAVRAYFEYDYSIGMIMQVIEPLEYFDEVKEIVQNSLRNKQYFLEDGREISSVLSGKEDIQDELNQIMDSAIGTENEIYRFLDFYAEAKEFYEKGEFVKAFDALAHSRYSNNLFDDSKRLLLKTAISLLENSNDKSAGDLFENIHIRVEKLFRGVRLFENQDGTIGSIEVPVADMIIADALVYSRSGLIDNVNKNLEDFINMGRDDIDRSQYEVLRKVFAFLKAYKQESMVLEAMVKYNIPRTELQEQRLVFLRENMNSLSSGSSGNMPKEIVYEKEDGKLVYDYRCLSWNESQIRNYFNFLSSEERVLDDVLVINEWANNLQIKTGLDWNLKELVENLKEGLSQNFGDKYQLDIVETASLTEDWLDYEESILIEEKTTWKYPWLSFVINAEQMTVSQISFSIYTLYEVKKDLLDEENLIKRNSKLATKLIAMKSKQNPKINNYISTMQTVLVSELEKYLNSNITVESIY